MEWSYEDGTLTVRPDGPFSAAETLFCGQCFRWRQGPGCFEGVVHGRALTLRERGDGAVLLTGLAESDAPYFLHYFAFDEDYAALQRRLERSKRLAECIRCAPGIRVLHQDFFEVLLTFIISQNNNIPRITGIVARLCEGFGAPLPGGGHAFPLPGDLAGRTAEGLAFLRAGWRAGYLLDAAQKVASGEVGRERLARLSTPEARALLMTIRGVGPKVADCVLLYGLGRAEACPMDVWMKRAMARRFPRGMPRCARELAGVAQQYIFHAERTAPQPQAGDSEKKRAPKPGPAGEKNRPAP